MASTTFFKINMSAGYNEINQQCPAYSNNGRHSCYSTRNHLITGLTPMLPPKYLSSANKVMKYNNNQRRGLVLKSKAEYANNAWIVDEIEKGDTSIIPSSLKEISYGGSVAVAEKAAVGRVKVKVEEEEELSRATLLWRAAKIPLYTVALIPVTVASAAAYWQTGVFSWGRFFGMLASFLIVNVWIKLSNDVYDYDTGADKGKKESVVNLFGSRKAINLIAWSLLGIGLMGFSGIAVAAKSPTSLLFLIYAVLCFYLYQCPPFRMSYYGVGEPLLFSAFGPISTIGFYLLHSRGSELPITSTITWLSIIVGLTTALILFCSHFHQIEGDKAVGKMSPLVRLGTEKASHVVKWCVAGLYMILFGLGCADALPFASVILGGLTIPVGISLVNFVQNNHKDKSKIFMGKYFVVRLHTILGMALSAGLVLARLMAKQIPLAI